MTFKEKLVKTILQEFLNFIETEESCENMQKELDNSSNPSIHCERTEKGVEQWKWH